MGPVDDPCDGDACEDDACEDDACDDDACDDDPCEEDPCEDDAGDDGAGRLLVAGAGVGRGVGAGAREASSAASSRSQAALVGAILSSAQASRWRRVATWLSQHMTEQKTRRMRARLQVETLHWKYLAPNAMSLRHALHTSQVSAMGAG